MSYTVSATDLKSIQFNEKNELNAVLQNIAVILSTPMGTVPLYRDFGLDWSFLDKPTPTVASNSSFMRLAAGRLTRAINSAWLSSCELTRGWKKARYLGTLNTPLNGLPDLSGNIIGGQVLYPLLPLHLGPKKIGAKRLLRAERQ